jgi:hypothetical protein
MKLNRPKRDYENLTTDIFKDCLRGFYVFCSELHNSHDNYFNDIINNRFLNLFQFSYDNDVFFEYCSFNTYHKLFENRFIEYKIQLIDAEKKDFAKIELEQMLWQYDNFENRSFWQPQISQILNNSKIKKIEFLNGLITNDTLNRRHQHENIFSNNGFLLFEYLMSNHIRPKGTKGRFADISDYYRKMFDSEIQYIHQRPEVFSKWFYNTYDKEDIGKIKTATNLKGIDRDKHYSTALDWFKTQNK